MRAVLHACAALVAAASRLAAAPIHRHLGSYMLPELPRLLTHPAFFAFLACHRSVAYQGVPGAYSEMAALKACPGWEPLPCEQFETAFQALSQVGRAALFATAGDGQSSAAHL